MFSGDLSSAVQKKEIEKFRHNHLDLAYLYHAVPERTKEIQNQTSRSGDEKLKQIQEARNITLTTQNGYISKILKVTLQQSLETPDKAKYDPW